MEPLAIVPSLTRHGESYRIWRDHGGNVSCECPAFGFSKTDCKHVRIYRFAAQALRACEHAPGGALCESCLLRLLARVAAKVARERKDPPQRPPVWRRGRIDASQDPVYVQGQRVRYRTQSGLVFDATVLARVVVGRDTTGYRIKLDDGQGSGPAYATRSVAWHSLEPAD